MKKYSFLTAIIFVLQIGYIQIQAQNYQWAKQLGTGGSQSVEKGNDIEVDGAGNSYVTGVFYSTADFDPGPGVATLSNVSSPAFPNTFLAKYNSTGSYIWAKHLSGANCGGLRLVLDISGNIYITGYFSGVVDFDPGVSTSTVPSVAGTNDIFLAKYDNNGNFLWLITLGSSGTDLGYDVAVDASSNVYLTGTFSGLIDFDPGVGTTTLTSQGNSDIFLAKYTSAGVISWAHGIGAGSADVGRGIAVDGGGNVFITGNFGGTADFNPTTATSTLSSVGTSDIFFSKFNSSGSFVWARSVGSFTDDIAHCIGLDANANLFIGGEFRSTVDFDPGSGSDSEVATADADIFVAKYDSSGNHLWAHGFGGNIYDAAFALTVEANGFCYLTGRFSGTTDFDPGLGTATITSYSGNPAQDLFFAKYDPSGGYQFAERVGGTIGADTGCGITASNGFLYLTGAFYGTVDFDPGSGVANLTTLGGNASDIFFAKYGSGCNVSIVASSNPICIGSTITLSTTATGNIAWSTGANSTSIVVTPTTSVGYTVSGTAPSGTTTCSNTVAINIMVNPLPTLTTAVSPSAICIGKSAVLSVFGGNTYSWSTGPTTSSITVSPLVNSVYTVTGVSTASCVKTQTLQVNVNKLPSVSAFPSKLDLCKGESVILSASGANSYSWSTGNTTPTISVNPTTPGGFTYTVTGTDNNGCSQVATVSFNVNDCVGHHTTFPFSSMQVFPSPTTGKINVECDQSQPVQILIHDVNGVLVNSSSTNTPNFTIDISDKSNGLYFITLKTEISTQTFKIIKSDL